MTEHDPNGFDPHAPGAKLDANKTLPWLMISGFANALQAVADVTTKGAAKYTPNGWMKVPDGESRYMEAFGRHALALGRGESVDKDTNCLHKAQMVWNLLASLELELREANRWANASTKLADSPVQSPPVRQAIKAVIDPWGPGPLTLSNVHAPTHGGIK